MQQVNIVGKADRTMSAICFSCGLCRAFLCFHQVKKFLKQMVAQLSSNKLYQQISVSLVALEKVNVLPK
jgi:hypothetical protein